MKVTLVGNAGVWIREPGVSLLLDSLYGKNEFFSSPLEEMNAAAAGQANHFRNTDIMLFSHRHEDHFNAAYVNNYLMHNEVKKVFIPKLTVPKNQWEDPGIVVPGTSGAQIISVGDHDEEIFYDAIADDCWVVFFRTIHMGGPMYHCNHYSIILICYGQSYLFMADTDWSYSVKNVKELLKGTKVQAAFINPLSYMDAAGKRWLREIQPKTAVIYHVPYTGEDKGGIRTLVKEEIARHSTTDWELLALTEPMQTVGV